MRKRNRAKNMFMQFEVLINFFHNFIKAKFNNKNDDLIHISNILVRFFRMKYRSEVMISLTSFRCLFTVVGMYILCEQKEYILQAIDHSSFVWWYFEESLFSSIPLQSSFNIEKEGNVMLLYFRLKRWRRRQWNLQNIRKIVFIGLILGVSILCVNISIIHAEDGKYSYITFTKHNSENWKISILSIWLIKI